ncbi:DUF6668 family protein [Paeniglutamicibacter sp. R2-26]|uniref:DUF6668 family protein n=1 Tax=Paeniglutamicibacter sp. R2-26 TaxID=3144417 RepID=UPI003EE797CF
MSGVSNPFVPHQQKDAETAAIDIRDDLMGASLVVNGPTHPGLSPHLEAPPVAWETRNVGPLEGVAVMGLHGGAGATTIASLLGSEATEVGRAWPLSHNAWTDSPWPIPVIAVARNDHSGLRAAETFIRSWATRQLTGSRLSALVLIDAGPRTSEARKKTTKRLLRMVPRGTHLPWMDSWLDAPPDPARLPLRLKRIIKLLNTPATTP